MVRFDDRAVVLGEFEQINRQSVRLSLCLCLRLTLCPSVSVVTVYVSLSGFRSICVYLMFDSQSVCQSVLLSVNMSVWLVCICVCVCLFVSLSVFVDLSVSIVWAFRRLKKPRCRVMSARGYALHSVCPQLSFFFIRERFVNSRLVGRGSTDTDSYTLAERTQLISEFSQNFGTDRYDK